MLESQVGTKYKLGHISDRKIHLYYNNSFGGKVDQIPSSQFEIVGTESGSIITFSLAPHFIIFGMFIPVIFLVIAVFRDAPIDIYSFVGGSVMLVLIALTIAFKNQLEKFKQDLLSLEKNAR